jgi:hypothetical protein
VYDRPAASITPHGEAESFSLQDLVWDQVFTPPRSYLM